MSCGTFVIAMPASATPHKISDGEAASGSKAAEFANDGLQFAK
jgi:hypothetical protein